MTEYDEAVLQCYAEALYARASWVIAKCSIFVGALGVLFGYGLSILWGLRGQSLKSDDTTGPMILFGILGTAVGYSIGESRAFVYKLRAQLALCQRQIERNTRS